MCLHRILSVNFFVFLFTCLQVGAYSQTETRNELESILTQLHSNQKALEMISMDVDIMTYDPDDKGGWQVMPVEKLVRKYRRNGMLLESDAKRFFLDKDGNFLYDNYEFKNVWDGQRSLSRQGSPTYTTGFVSKKHSESKPIIYSTKIGNILDGFFPHNEAVGNLFDLFKSQHDSFSLRPSKEMVGEYLCDVIEADTSSGKYVIWVDAGSRYCIRRAEVEIDENDLAWGRPLHQKSRSCNCSTSERIHYRKMKWELREVEVAKIQDTYIPVSGTLTQDSYYQDGTHSKVKFVFKRDHINLAPDFEALGAFKMDMPDGTIVYDLDIHGLKYRWNKDGEMTAYIEKKASRDFDLVDNWGDGRKDSSKEKPLTTKADSEALLEKHEPKTHKPAMRNWAYLLPIPFAVLVGVLYWSKKSKT